MADIGTLKRLYLLKAKRALPQSDDAARAKWLEDLLLAPEGPGEELTQGGWEITNQSASGRSSVQTMHATQDERSAAILAAIADLTGDPTGAGIMVPNFQAFRP